MPYALRYGDAFTKINCLILKSNYFMKKFKNAASFIE